ncbi:MAG: hypothetical protein ACLTZT_13425 [Butyricimonas faecalis]
MVKEEQKPVVKKREIDRERGEGGGRGEAFPVLPTIHFKRNLAVIDTVCYAGELSRIVEALKEFSE